MSELVIKAFVDTDNVPKTYLKAMIEGCGIFAGALGGSPRLNIDGLDILTGDIVDAPEIIQMFPPKTTNREEGSNNNAATAQILGKGLFIVATGRDLKLTETNFCFGASSFTRSALIASCNRLSPLAFRYTIAHELGHLAAMVGTEWPNHDNRGGLYEDHCKNPCIMRQAVSSQEAEITAAEIDCFCDDCLGHLRRVGQLI